MSPEELSGFWINYTGHDFGPMKIFIHENQVFLFKVIDWDYQINVSDATKKKFNTIVNNSGWNI